MSDLTLTAFLLARYDEAEAHARAMHERRCGTSPELVVDPLGRPMPVECECDWHVVGVLADLAAKRRIITEVHCRAADHPAYGNGDPEWVSGLEKEACAGCGTGGPYDDFLVDTVDDCPTLRLLAQPFSEHADFDPGWRV